MGGVLFDSFVTYPNIILITHFLVLCVQQFNVHVLHACQKCAIFTSVLQHFSNRSLVQCCFVFLILTKICMKVFTYTTREIFGNQKAFLCQPNISKLLFYIYSFNYSLLSCQTHSTHLLHLPCVLCLFYLFNLHHQVSQPGLHTVYYTRKSASYTISWKLCSINLQL